MSLETGKMGKFAGGAVVAKSSDTMVYSTLCVDRKPLISDFAPLRADYFTRFRYAASPIVP